MVSCHPNRAEDPGDPTQFVVSDLKFKIDHVHMEIVIGFCRSPAVRAPRKLENCDG